MKSYRSGLLAAALLSIVSTSLPPAEPPRAVPQPRQDPKDAKLQLSKAAQKRARRALRGKR